MGNKMLAELRDGFVRSKITLSVLALLGYLLLICLSGGSIVQMAVFWLCAALYIYFPGRFFARATGLERALPGFSSPLAILFGTGFFAALYCFCMRLGFLWVLRLVPPVLGAVWLAPRAAEFFALRTDLRKARADGRFMGRVLLWAGLCALFALTVSVKNAHPKVAGEIILTQDLLWNIGNANSFKIEFPPQDIRFSMVRLAYHYLTEMVFGALSIVSGVSCYDIFAFYAGPLVLAALLCCLYALGLHFYGGDRVKALLFPLVLFLFNCASLGSALLNGRGVFWNTNLQHLITNINSQATALIFISIFLVLFGEAAKRQFQVSWLYVASLVGAAVLVCFAKGPAAAIVVCSFVVTMLFLAFRKPRWGRWAVCFAGVAGVFAATYFIVFASGVNTSVRFGFKTQEGAVICQWLHRLSGGGPNAAMAPWCLVLGSLLTLFCMQPFQLPLYLRGLWRDVRGVWKLPADRLLVHGIVAGGVLAYFLFWHPSYSQVYFALIAIFGLNLLAVDELTRVRTKRGCGFTALCGAVGIATTVVLVINFTGSGARQLARNLDIIPKYRYASTVRAGDELAMEWMAQNTPRDALFATNRVNSMAYGEDGISNVYSALSGRQAYMEGYTYAVTNMGVSEAVVNEKRTTNAALFDAEQPYEEIKRLCDENNISYLVYSKQFEGAAPQPGAFALVYENADVAIYAVQ